MLGFLYFQLLLASRFLDLKTRNENMWVGMKLISELLLFRLRLLLIGDCINFAFIRGLK